MKGRAAFEVFGADGDALLAVGASLLERREDSSAGLRQMVLADGSRPMAISLVDPGPLDRDAAAGDWITHFFVQSIGFMRSKQETAATVMQVQYSDQK